MSKFRDTKSYITNKINHSKKINFTEMKGAKRSIILCFHSVKHL